MIYNRLPNLLTGLKLMELLTQTNTDHKYILCCHEWGCPIFLLDEKLQGGKKISNEIVTCDLGNFGFFWWALFLGSKYSKLYFWVNISPISRCVWWFFQIVWWTGEDEAVTDAIINQFFEHNQYFYVEKDFGQDGEFIYSPSPLYVVWLGKPKLFSWKKN